MAYTLTVFVEPNNSITLSDRDVERLLTKLRQLETALGSFPERADFTDAIARIEAGETDARGVRFKPGEDVGILRALDELRLERPLGAACLRLRDLLVATIGPAAITYQLELQRLDGLDRSKVFFSWSGPYTVGERLPVLPEGECWEVVEVRETDPGFNDELVCRPCPKDTSEVLVGSAVLNDPPADADLYDCDGIPVSETAGGPSLAWDRPEPRRVSNGFTQSEGVSINRPRFDELRELWRRNGYTNPFRPHVA